MGFVKVFATTLDASEWWYEPYQQNDKNDKQKDLLKKIECLEKENHKMKVYLKNLASKLKQEVGHITADLEDYFL